MCLAHSLRFRLDPPETLPGRGSVAAHLVSPPMNARVNCALVTVLHAVLAEGLALCGAMAMEAGADMPDWVHLLRAGSEIRTLDGRGPYRADLNAIASGFAAGARLVLDENHSTDLASPEGRPAPAMGWIVALEARDSGLWGRVEWTEAGIRQWRPRKPSAASRRCCRWKRAPAASPPSCAPASSTAPNIKDLSALHQETDSILLLARLIGAVAVGPRAESRRLPFAPALDFAAGPHTPGLASDGLLDRESDRVPRTAVQPPPTGGQYAQTHRIWRWRLSVRGALACTQTVQPPGSRTPGFLGS